QRPPPRPRHGRDGAREQSEQRGIAVLHRLGRRAVPQPAVHGLRPRRRRADRRREDPRRRRHDEGHHRGGRGRIARYPAAFGPRNAASTRCAIAAIPALPADVSSRSLVKTAMTYGVSPNGSTIPASLRTAVISPVLCAHGVPRGRPRTSFVVSSLPSRTSIIARQLSGDATVVRLSREPRSIS